SLDDDVFHLIYQLTSEWEAVDKCLPHIMDTQQMQNKRKITRSESFICSFIINARQLADSLNIPLIESGMLYDQILFTGCESSADENKPIEKINLNKEDTCIISTTSTISSMHDRSQSPTTLSQNSQGKGQMLFIVKQIKSFSKSSNNNEEAIYCTKTRDKGIIETFQKLGFRFADPRLIAPIMAQNVGIPVRQMQNHLEKMYQYSISGSIPYLETDGVYAGLFVTRNEKYYADGSFIRNGLEILVMENHRHQIPVSKLPTIKTIGEIEMNYIKLKEGIHLDEFISQLRTSFLGAVSNFDSTRSKNNLKFNKRLSKQNAIDYSKDNIDSLNLTSQQNDVLDGFKYELAQSLHRLIHIVSEEQLYSNAKLVPKIFDIPITSSSTTKDKQKFAKLIIFYLILSPNVKPKLSRGEVCFLPFGMFEVYQNILYYNSKIFGKFMQTQNNTNNNRISNDEEGIEMTVIENNDIDIEKKDTWTFKNLISLLQSKPKDVRQFIRNTDEKRWYHTIIEDNYVNDTEINVHIEVKSQYEI
ncbi:10659_t:CDS:2, partial [Scutellospora calospora]